ncbi:hypothetical protein [Mesobacillus sp. S13]|nr:hypothetical protein [Mesobacillus sp. S13]
MYGFLLNMWIMGRVTETQINNYVGKGFITQEEADMILATPQKDSTEA